MKWRKPCPEEEPGSELRFRIGADVYAFLRDLPTRGVSPPASRLAGTVPRQSWHREPGHTEQQLSSAPTGHFDTKAKLNWVAGFVAGDRRNLTTSSLISSWAACVSNTLQRLPAELRLRHRASTLGTQRAANHLLPLPLESRVRGVQKASWLRGPLLPPWSTHPDPNGHGQPADE